MWWLLLLCADPAGFWEVKPPIEWSVGESRQLLADSPWAQRAPGTGKNVERPIFVYLASAEPMMAAEDRVRAALKRENDPAWLDYREYYLANASKFIVVAIGGMDPMGLLDNTETKRMEKESVLIAGRRKYHVATHFPPTPSDPMLRLLFPRDVRDGDKSLRFELYVPGGGSTYRDAEFPLKQLVYRGKASY